MQPHPTPQTTPTLAELTDAGVPAEILGLDGWSPAVREAVGSFIASNGGEWPGGDVVLVGKPTTEDARRNYESLLKSLWKVCAAHDIEDLAAVTNIDRQSVVTLWLADQAKTDAPKTLDHRRVAVRWWARQNRLNSPVTKKAAKFKGKGKGIGQAKSPGVEGYSKILTALHNKEVITPKSESQTLACEGWHLRQMATTTAAVSMSLRSAAELPQFKDSHVAEITDRGVHLILPKSKTNPEPTDVWLEFRDDLGCPVTALARSHAFYTKHGITRHGLLYPAWHRKRTHNFTVATRHDNFELKQWNLIRDHCELPERATLHGLRAFLPTEGIKAGESHVWARDQLRHSLNSLSTTALYARSETQTSFGLLDDIGPGPANG
jgi:hypothetical protein